MKKILFLLLLFILSACATHRQSEKQLSSSDIAKTSTETVRNESAQFSGITDTERNENTEIQIYIIRYDTSQPADPATGKPPVKEEETHTVGKHVNEKTKSEQGNKSDITVSGKQTADTQTNLDTDEKTDTSADVAGGRNFIWVWIAAIAFVCLLIYLFIKK